MIFSHSGAIGDIIYHLPVVRELGGGDFYVIPADLDGYRCSNDMQFRSIAPLLETVPFLSKSGWSDRPVGICFNGWRRVLDFRKSLTNQAAAWLGMADIPATCDPWLIVDSNPVAAVTISNSNRNNHPEFPWNEVVRRYGKHAVFIGPADEYAAFVERHGDIPHYPTADMLEAARAIKGSKFHIGNPSAPVAVAEGLKHPCIVASMPSIDACVFYHRPGHQHCWGKVDWWEI